MRPAAFSHVACLRASDRREILDPPDRFAVADAPLYGIEIGPAEAVAYAFTLLVAAVPIAMPLMTGVTLAVGGCHDARPRAEGGPRPAPSVATWRGVAWRAPSNI